MWLKMRKKIVSDHILLLRKGVKRGEETLIHYSDYSLKELDKVELSERIIQELRSCGHSLNCQSIN